MGSYVKILIGWAQNFNQDEMMQNLSYPLSIFGRPDTDTTMKLFKNLVKQLLDSFGYQEYFQSIRSLIEDVFKLAKDAFSLQKFHRYTTRSVKKAVSLNVLLSGLVISLGFRSKKQLQQLSEW